MDSVTCRYCGNLHNNRTFCNRQCNARWQSINWKGEKSPCYEQFIVKCSNCDKDIQVNKYKKNNTKNICCSYECSNKIRSVKYKGKNNPNYGNKLSEDSRQICRDRTLLQLENHEIGFSDTLPERIVENQLLFNDILYIKQYRYKLGVADFYLPEHHLIIECDGDYWHNLSNYIIRDKKQTEYLLDEGYAVLRLCEHDIKNDIGRCLSWIV